FNNVIGAIMGWAELGQEQTPADSRLHSHFKKIREQAERAAGLTRQLLAFARRQVLEPRNLNLNQTIVDFVGLLGNILGDLIELRTVAAPDLGVIRADPTQLERVLMNLCVYCDFQAVPSNRLILSYLHHFAPVEIWVNGGNLRQN